MIGLAFYMAHRPEGTCANRVLRVVLGETRADEGRTWLAGRLRVAEGVKGCLPSALWVMASTCVVGGWRLMLANGRTFSLAMAPVVINGLWEAVQWIGLTDGRADAADVVAGLFGWGMAAVIPLETESATGSVPGWRDWRLGALAGVWALMGFADVL